MIIKVVALQEPLASIKPSGLGKQKKNLVFRNWVTILQEPEQGLALWEVHF